MMAISFPASASPTCPAASASRSSSRPSSIFIAVARTSSRSKSCISTPAKWAPELAKNQGLYKTLRWQIDTWAISEGFADEQMFWDDMNFTVAQSRKMFDSFLAGDSDLVVQCFEFPDRVGHVFWRF